MSSAPPPSDVSSSPPPPAPPTDSTPSTSPPSSDNSSPPSDGSTSPPPPSPSPPPPSPDNPSPPPPTTDNPSPPPPSNDNPSPPPESSDNQSPPPPSNGNSSPPPSPPSGSGNNTSPSTPPSGKDSPPGNNNSPPSGGGSNKSPPSSKSDGNTPSPPSGSKGDSSKGDDTSQLAPPKSDSSNNDKALISGAATGAGLLLLIMIVFLISCAKRKKRKRNEHELKFYRDNAPDMKSYYNNNQSWQNAKTNDLMVKIPPLSSGISSEHGWAVPPPPPPPMMSSSEMSSVGFSGSHPPPPPHPAVALGFNQSSFTYEDLAAATGGFAQENLLGQGGFGYVHKGVLPNGKEIAVKSLKLNSGQGEREFQAEVDIISRVHHRHLVSLVGWCSTGSQRMLVYEFVPNSTLEYHLHGAGRPVMDFPTRLKIALGSAKGFAYLHEDCHPRIIHRDIKAANILIDNNFEAKVADFGLAKLSSDNYTHVSTRIMGTFGYLAPEYASSGKLTEKSDVYSFGIMLLELITGRRPIDIHSDEDSLVDWARPILMRVPEGGSYEELVDPRLGNNYDPQEMLHMVACAGACIRHSARGRPKMSQIVRALEGDVSLDDLNAGVRGSTLSSNGSDYDLKRFGKGGALSSQEFSGSEEGQTGEYRS